jgi:MOSC domain-containing protein YiiM
MKSAHIVQINVNQAGGVPKYRVACAVVTVNGVAGDKQRNQQIHGGSSRAVSLYAYEHIQALQAEGHPIAPGTTGENLTISGLEWDKLQVGDQLIVGDHIQLELTSYAPPCVSIARSFANGKLTRLSHKVNPGWSRFYARVLKEGMLQEGDRVRLVRAES